ncbi:hypothetical protein B0T21DRAFT_184667 [Apiosordaria backusii]|uniref:Zn(2)-C6 fungal-type domain-containing protein n=1 Tax=Apiosordaria backusii TaxID=314023 RepID=A0AA40BJK1_9PEZI|nr:hypothetical protein B0T21DRAFT_184667 [Apiosordaria backusii]
MDNMSTNTYKIIPGQGASHTGPETGESNAGLAPLESWYDSFDFEFEQWQLDQELQGLSSLGSSGPEYDQNATALTPQSSSVDFDPNEPLRTSTPQATVVAPFVTNDSSFECVSLPDVLSFDSAICSLPSNDLVNPLGLGSATGVFQQPLRHDTTSSGYYGDHSNKEQTENTSFSEDQSLQEKNEAAPEEAYVIRSKHRRPATESNFRNNVSKTPSQLTPENIASHDCFFALRHILPRPESHRGPSGNTELDAHTSSLVPRKGKRKPNTDAGRKKIKLVRRVGACIRCRIFKESCDENTPCGRCKIALANAKVYQLPCYREPLDNVIAFRAGNARAGKIRSEPMCPIWASDDPKPRTVILSYPFKAPGSGAGSTLTVQCRQFIPKEWDVLEEPWEIPTGEVITMKSSPFAFYDQDANVASVADYIKATKADLLDESMDGVEDQLLRLTTAEATRYCLKFENSAVATAMNIRAASFFSRTKMIMTGTNVLDLPYFGDSRFLLNGGFPVPGILDYQIDYLAIRYMLGQMELLVKQLKKLIFTKNQRKSWYEVYLTVFVLLQSLETVHARQMDILRRYEGQGPEAFSRVRIVGTRMIEEWEYSAKILIYHYRAVLKGMVPFAATWNDKHVAELRRECGLDEEALQYTRQMSDIIGSRADLLKQISKENLDNASAKPLVWIAQLYVDDVT